MNRKALSKSCGTEHAALRRRMVIGVGLLAVGALPGCASYYYGEKYGSDFSLGQKTEDLITSSYRAADAVLQMAPIDLRAPVLVATLVNLEALYVSSPFGRVVSEQIAGRFVQRGVPVPELRLRDAVALVPETGALLLSRELRDVSRSQAAQAVLVGTYTVSRRQVFVSLKLVRPEGNTTIAAFDYAMPMTDDLRMLLGMP